MDARIQAKQDSKIQGKKDFEIQAKQDSKIQAQKDFEIQAKQDVKIQAEQDSKIQGKKDFEIQFNLIKWNWRLNGNQKLLCYSSLRNTEIKCWLFLRICFTFKVIDVRKYVIYCLMSILPQTIKQVDNFYGVGGMQVVQVCSKLAATLDPSTLIFAIK